MAACEYEIHTVVIEQPILTLNRLDAVNLWPNHIANCSLLNLMDFPN